MRTPGRIPLPGVSFGRSPLTSCPRPAFHAGRGEGEGTATRVITIFLLVPFCVLSLSACSPAIRPSCVQAGGRPVVLTSSGLFIGENGGFRRASAPDELASGEVAGIHAAGGETWVTYAPGAKAGATKLLPPPARTFTTKDGFLDNRVAQVVSVTPPSPVPRSASAPTAHNATITSSRGRSCAPERESSASRVRDEFERTPHSMPPSPSPLPFGERVRVGVTGISTTHSVGTGEGGEGSMHREHVPECDLFFSYDSALNLGISVLSGTVWTHFTPVNSPLRGGRVAELVPDARGGVWVRYLEDGLGVARLAAGKLSPYDTVNTTLPTNAVELIRPEPPGEGLPGDFVWLATVDGLTRMDLGTGEWKHYGQGHGAATDFLRVTGLDQLFTSAILDIRDIGFTPGSVWLLTPRKLFRFDGEVFHPVTAPFVEGLEKLRFSCMTAVSGTVWVALEDLDSRRIGALASYEEGAGWKLFRLTDLGVPEPEEIGLFVTRACFKTFLFAKAPPHPPLSSPQMRGGEGRVRRGNSQ